MSKSFTLTAIATALNSELIGDGALTVTRLAHPADIRDPQDLALAVDQALVPLLRGTRANAAIVGKDCEIPDGLVKARIVVERPRLALAKLTALFAIEASLPAGTHPTAIIEPGVTLGANVAIGAFVHITAGAVIGDNCVIHSHCSIGADAVIGRNGLLHPGARIGPRVVIGENVIIHSNTTIGADGFSFVTPQLGSVEEAKLSGGKEVGATNQELVRIASLGTVVLGNNVEVGANSSIDRGTIAATTIGNGTKIDNQVQIGHNVQIGENCLICGRVGIAGSAEIGHRVVLGGAVGVADHVKVGDDVIAMAMSGVASNVQPRTVIGGIPALPRDRLVRNLFNIGRMKQFFAKIDILTARLDSLEQKQKKD